MKPEEPVDYNHPVAYDTEGKPLYAHPPTKETELVEPQVVHVSRSAEPAKQKITPELQQKHDISKNRYPTLNLSDGEYVISAIRRHPIGLLLPMTVGVVLLAMALTLLFNFDLFAQTFGLTGVAADPLIAAVPILMFSAMIVIGVYVVYYVYGNNKFFLTNESVIQITQNSLFSHREQAVSLGSVEDASYSQNGIIQQIVGYGSIRLSTVGDESSYRFNYVANPKKQIALLNSAVEAFKNGRAVKDVY
jgi:Bacterial PH domain